MISPQVVYMNPIGETGTIRQQLFTKGDANEHAQACQTDAAGPGAEGQDDVEGLVSLPNHGHTPAKATALAGVSPGTARKWLVRYQAEGWAGLQDRDW